MMLSTIFIILLGSILLNPLTIDAGVYLKPAPSSDVTDLESKLNDLIRSTKHLTISMGSVAQKVDDIITNQQQLTTTLTEDINKLNNKIEKLQRDQDDQESLVHKLTAVEFTLNHVLSKVVYLSDNSPARAVVVPQPQESIHTSTHSKTNLEILTRLNDLLRHVQNIERDHCRRRTIPAAAGPINISPSNTSKIDKPSNCSTVVQTLHTDELFRKLEQRLNSLIPISTEFNDLKTFLSNAKHIGENIENVLNTVQRSDKRLEQWTSDDTQQRSWQPMLEYCQGVSEEVSTFAGNSDVSLKLLESLMRDVKEKLNYISNKNKKVVDAKCTHGNFNGNNNNNTLQSNETQAAIDDVKENGCHELSEDNQKDGVYKFAKPDINEDGRDFNMRYCAFATDERAWTVIQRRGPFDVQENFNRSWADYRNGFGQLDKDFWFGNEFIHRLTYYNTYELLIELENFDGGIMSVAYGTFGLDNESYNYNLFIGDHKGPGPDSFSYHNYMDFSTYDRSNGKNVESCCTCAIGYGSGWWFDNCLEANLNGIYHDTPLDHNYVGIIWDNWLKDYSLKATRMLIRPKNWTSNTDVTRAMQQNHEDP